jgi:uncharacterized RDD family membrane protein YckC
MMRAEKPPVPTLYGRYAGFASRLLAYVVDRLIILGLLLVLSPVVTFLLDALPTPQLTREMIIGLLALLPTVTGAIYTMGFWLLAGQTPGKRVMGVRIIRTDGRRLNLGNVFRRWVGYWISTWFLLGFLWILVDRRRMGWHDHIAGTLVVYAWPETDVTRQRHHAWLPKRQEAGELGP